MTEGKTIPEPSAPGHTDLMVSPESIDAFLEANPLPPEPSEAEVEAAAKEHYANIFPGYRWEATTELYREEKKYIMRVALRVAARVRSKANG